MKIKNIVGECLLRMGLEDFLSNTSFSSQEQELVNKIVGAINIVYNEICAEYLPLVAREQVVFENGKLSFSQLEKRILYPIKLESNGKKCKYVIYPDRLESDECGEGTLKYAYLVNSLYALEDDIDDNRLSEGVVCLGALAQYYFANKMFELAKSFDEDFRAKISSLCVKQKQICIKQRRWGA